MSGEIISGYAFYSRKTKPGDYEHEQADVRLDFNVAEGVEHDAILAKAGNAAKAKVQELLGLTKSAPALPPQLASAGPTKADLAAAASAAVGAPKSGTAEDKPKTTRVPKAAKPAEPAPAPAPAPATDDDDTADLLGAAPAPITDAELLKLVQDTNARIKNAPAIRELTRRYVQPPKGVKDVPQELRPKYVEELTALKPAG